MYKNKIIGNLMPTYEYKCEDCGYIFEEFQGINESVIGFCPRCSGEVKRLITNGGGIIFKGSGFYCNDYVKDNVKKEKKENAT